ncbi:MAG: transglutaminase family protein [Leptospirillia bacterium]
MDPLSPTLEQQHSERLQALVILLGDDDPQVAETISGHIREAGVPALPTLRAVLSADNPTLRERARVLVRELTYTEIIEDIRDFSRNGANNLEEGLLLVSRLDEPDLDVGACAVQLARMTEDLMLRLDPGDGVDAMLSRMARYLFDEMGFAGNAADYYNEKNSYLHTLLETRKGIPISLSCLYLILGHRLGLAISGLGVPGHFLIRYEDRYDTRIVDPFHRGRTLDRDECVSLLRGLGLAFDDRYLEPVNTRYVLERTLKNLITVFSERGDQTALDLHQRALDALRSA